jgi:uncharacterized alpha/beta hydrolase family protein
LLCFFLAFSGNGCIFSKLKKDLAELEISYGLRGKIVNNSPHQKGLFVVVYEETPQGIRISEATILDPATDYFTLEVPKGTYFILAFEDLNNNLAYDKGEPIGYYGKPDAIEISDQTLDVKKGRVRMGLDFSVSDSNSFPEILPSEFILSQNIIKDSFIKIGERIGFEDRILADEYGQKGYWEPLAFLREVGAGVFFLENYDANKTPVLFIHGAVGTPLAWKETVSHMDLDHFQPWFFYYPSGMPLDKISKMLNIMVEDLRGRYEFKKLYVVAHSMGGLVARSFILRNVYESNQKYIKLFISIATPWNGHRMTAKGVEQAPTAVPSWYDMVPDSPFIQSLFEKKLPPFMKYYLFFSFKGDCSLFMENNDGTVELSSVLDERAQAEADWVFGYNEDHTSILSNQRVFSKINELLEE